MAQIGGSNYVVYNLGNYNAAAGYLNACAPSTVQTVLGAFEDNPALVQQQLQQMFSDGQRQIALTLFYAPQTSDVSGLCVNSSAGAASAQVAQNIQNVLTLIKNIGFNHVFFRFAYAGPAVSTWTSWNETQYQQNWNFEISVRTLVEQTLSGSNVARTYDLGLELGCTSDNSSGVATNQLNAYMAQLWSDYCYSTSCKDSYGFSIAWSTNAYSSTPTVGSCLTNEYYLLKSTGYPVPSIYGLDIYNTDGAQAFISAYNSLKLIGQTSSAIVVQEAFYNDRTTIDSLYQAQEQVPLNVSTIIQWPFIRNSSVPNFSSAAIPSINYEQYLSPYIISATATCNSGSCWVSISGTSFASPFTVNLYPGNWSTGNTPIATITGINGNSGAGGFAIPASVYPTYSSLNIQVINPDGTAYADPYFISLPTSSN